MLLKNKNAIVYGGGGVIGGAVARAFARSHAIPEAAAMGSLSRDVFRQVGERVGVTIDEMLVGGAQGTLLKRLPKLAEVANTAVFLASEHAGAMTGAVANLTCGMILD
jgi:NAD(P)-dependent dehydrogenase (short-subunit alcohol dehydrogenase family)